MFRELAGVATAAVMSFKVLQEPLMAVQGDDFGDAQVNMLYVFFAFFSIVDLNATLIPLYIVERSGSRNEFFLQLRSSKKAVLLAEKAVLLEAHSQKKEAEIVRMQSELNGAQKLIKSVMDVQGDLLSPYELRYDEIEQQGKLGEGAFGTVYKGVLRGSTAVAIKTMRIGKVTEQRLAEFKREIIVS